MLWINPLEQFNILVLIDLCYKDFWVVLTNISVMFLFNIIFTSLVIYLVNNSFYLNNFQLFFRFLFLFVWNNIQDSISMKNYSLVSLYYFLFIDYIYIINYISFFSRNVPRVFSLPVKMNSYSVLRSPFVFSKSREDFVVNHYCLFFSQKKSFP